MHKNEFFPTASACQRLPRASAGFFVGGNNFKRKVGIFGLFSQIWILAVKEAEQRYKKTIKFERNMLCLPGSSFHGRFKCRFSDSDFQKNKTLREKFKAGMGFSHSKARI